MNTKLPYLVTLFLLGAASMPALSQDIGAVTPASLPVPLPTASPVPPNVLRAQNPYYMSVTGTWKFALTHGHVIGGGQYVSEAGTGAVSASSSQSGNGPQNAFDGDGTTRWCADSDDLPQFIQADLGAVRHITGVDITWEQPAVTYQCKLEGSVDLKQWSAIADDTAAPGIGNGPVAVTPGDYRYFRLTVTGDSGPDAWASIYECLIHYSDNGQDLVWHYPMAATASSQAALDAFTQPAFDDKKWDSIPVPSNWEVLGYSIPTYNDVDNTVGQYRRWVDIPAAWSGKKVYWRFDGALDGAELYVNGQRAGYHESGFTAFDVDVSGLIKPGQRNLLAARVSKTVPSDDCETGDFQCLGGIFRETALIAVPPTHVTDITVQTPLSANYKNATLNAAITVEAPVGATVGIHGYLVSTAGATAGVPVTGNAIADTSGIATVTLSMPVKAPRLWSAEKPNLYYLVMQISSGGQPVERVEQRFGFKQLDIKNNVVLWNGVPIKCTGICRHDFWSDKGFALSDAEWNKDITMMKAANINAIRTSHYNHAERFLELCEERGIYIIDEVPFCWINGSMSDPNYTKYMVQRAAETVARDKNRPCVLAWSIGNENPDGPNGQVVFDYIRAKDPTRPAFVSCLGTDQIMGQEWNDEHYPGPDTIDRDAKRVGQTINYTENPHTFYEKGLLDYDPAGADLWSEALIKVWDKVWNAPNILGSFIWEWQSQGIADNNPDRTVGFDTWGTDHLRQENNKGIVDGYRNPKPEYWIVKQVYSPIRVGLRSVSADGGSFTVPITNSYSFTDLSELTTKWWALSNGKVLKSGVEHISCPPLQSVQATFPAPDETDTLRLEFDHPDGSSVVADNLAVVGAPKPAPPVAYPAGSALTATNAAETVTVGNDLQTVVFDKSTGSIQSWLVHGHSVIVGGPIVNFGELERSSEKNTYQAKTPPVTQNASVVAATPDANGVVRVTVTSNVLSGDTGAPLGTLTAVYDIQPDAEIGVKWNVGWTGADTALFEDGVKFSVPSALTNMTWLRDAYLADYPAGHIGEPYGTASPTDLLFRGSKRSLHWLTLTDGSGSGIALLQAADGTPLIGRANAADATTTLFASTESSGPGGLSGSWVENHDINAGRGKPLGGEFILRAIVASSPSIRAQSSAVATSRRNVHHRPT
jgi:beta-galactosidase